MQHRDDEFISISGGIRSRSKLITLELGKGVGMHCRRCPHLVRHGQLGEDKKSIEFKNLCGLVIKQQLLAEMGPENVPMKKMPRKIPKSPEQMAEDLLQQACKNYPFPQIFDYIDCDVYQSTFKSASRKNDVIPTSDFQYSDALNSSSITDMELL